MSVAKARQEDWKSCINAVERMRTALDELEEYSGLFEETASLREQLERVESACAAGMSGKKGRSAGLPDGDPRTAAQSLIARLPLRKIFQNKQLADVFLSELMLALARESSHENRRELQRKGIAAAKAQGVQFGKPSRPVPDNFEDVRRAWREGRISLKEAAKTCAMPQSTFYGMAQRAEEALREARGAPEAHEGPARRREDQSPVQTWAG